MAEVSRTAAEVTVLEGTTRTGNLTNNTDTDDTWYEAEGRRTNRVADLLALLAGLEVFKDGDLTFGVRASRYNSAAGVVTYAGSTTQALTDNTTNYIYLTAAGTLTVNTTGFPASSRVELATILTSGGTYAIANITDKRDAAVLSASSADDASVYAVRGATDILSAASLRAAYLVAAALTPGGNALAADNRAIVFMPPGRYDFGTGDGTNHGLEVDTEFVDLAGMGAVPLDVILTSQINTASRGTLEQTADDVTLSNFAMEMVNATYTPAGDATDIAPYFPSTNLPNTKLNDITLVIPFASYTHATVMRPAIEYSGTYNDVVASSILSPYGFGGRGGTASGTFNRCVMGASAFGHMGTASGTFTDCVSRSDSFAFAGLASGTFTRCEVIGQDSFGAWDSGVASGTFVDCKGSGGGCFGGRGGIASGTFTRCSGGSRTFGGNDGATGTASGTFIDCEGQSGSFASFAGSGLTAVMRRCRMVASVYPLTNWEGLMEDCTLEVTAVDGNCVEVTAANPARIYNSTLIANGAGKSVYAGEAANCTIAHCRMNLAIDGDITNLIGTPYNVIDTDVSL